MQRQQYEKDIDLPFGGMLFVVAVVGLPCGSERKGGCLVLNGKGDNLLCTVASSP